MNTLQGIQSDSLLQGLQEPTDDRIIANTSLELLEQHQAKEQARLLQRFKQLREWQKQQQQQLMLQQQQQLNAWQEEQSKVQSLIAIQRSAQWNKGIVPVTKLGCAKSQVLTPPSKPFPSAENNSYRNISEGSSSQGAINSGLVSVPDAVKSQNSLPKPVMYIDSSKPASINDEDKYTSSELFSNPGSQEDELDIINNEAEGHALPDWMSDSSENFIPSKLPPLRPGRSQGKNCVNDQLAGLEHLLTIAPAGLLQQVLKLLPAAAGNRVPPSCSTDDVERSASPTLLGPGQQPVSRKLQFYHSLLHLGDVGNFPLEASVRQHQKNNFSDQEQHQQLGRGQQECATTNESFKKRQQQLTLDELDVDPCFIPRTFMLDGGNVCENIQQNGVDKNNENEVNDNQWVYEDDEEELSDSQDSAEDDDHSTTIKEIKDSFSADERPIQGTCGRKTFEQLLQEQLLQEQEELHTGSQQSPGRQYKNTFLKKGEGILRFASAPTKKAPQRPPAAKSQRKPPHQPQENPSSKDTVKGKQDSEETSLKVVDNIEDCKKVSFGSRLKDRSKSGGPVKPICGWKVKAGSSSTSSFQDASAPNKSAGIVTSALHSFASKKLEEQRSGPKEKLNARFQKAELDHIDVFRKGGASGGVNKSPSLESQSNGWDDCDSVELDSLAEFELLEDAADNMSFCSNSSMVKKLVTNDKRSQKEVLMRLKIISEMKKRMNENTSAGNKDLSKALPLGETLLNTTNELDVKEDEAIINCNNNNNNGYIQQSKWELSSYSSNVPSTTEPVHESCDIDEGERTLGGTITVSAVGRQAVTGPSSDSSTSMSSDSLQLSSKAITRKVAPLASKFTKANDTLSILKTLSLQAELLTSGKSASGTGQFFPPLNESSSPNGIPSGNTASSSSANHHQHHSTVPSVQEVPIQFAELSHDLKLHSLPAKADANSQSSATLLAPSGLTRAALPPQLSGETANGYITSSGGTNILNDSVSRPAQEKSYKARLYEAEESAESDSSSDDDDDDDDDDNDDNDDASSRHSDNSVNGGMYSEHEEEACRESEHQVEKAKGNEMASTKSVDVPGGFDDETTWIDDENDKFENQTCLKTAANTVTAAPVSTTPPTSKLVARLFPKLKPKPSGMLEKAVEVLQQAPVQPGSTSAGMQSLILREKLKELDMEIERFRSENASLEKLRRGREEGLGKLKQEIEKFQQEKEEDLKRLEEFKSEEMKKLRRERKLFESYQKKVRSMPDKREREEIDALKSQLQELQEELKQKESRWNSSTARLKSRLAEIELENGELREEVRILEKKRLEWMLAHSSSKSSQADSGKMSRSDESSSGVGKAGSKLPAPQPRNSTPTKVREPVKVPVCAAIQNNNFPQANKGKASGNGISSGTGSTISGRSGQGPAAGSSSHSVLPKTAAAGKSWEKGDCQNNTVPIMMENTLAVGAQVSSMPDHAPPTMDPSDISAAVVAMEKAAVDKGDVSAFVETIHQDGKIEKTYKTGAKEIRFLNGTAKEISPDGQTIVCRFTNGDVRQIFPDHRVVYIFAEAQILQTTFPDGLETFQFKNGQIERRFPDGTVEITFPSKDIKYLFPDGGQEVILTDGTVMQYSSKGERTIEYPSGDREMHTADYQRREFPDGIIKTVYSDGRHETRFPNGRVRMRDKEGNVILDDIVYR